MSADASTGSTTSENSKSAEPDDTIMNANTNSKQSITQTLEVFVFWWWLLLLLLLVFYFFPLRISLPSNSAVKQTKLTTSPIHPFCRSRELTNGTWKGLSEPLIPIAPCCGWDSSAYLSNPLCEGMALAGGHACDCNPDLVLMYQWEPSNCQLHIWNSSHFCNLLDNRIMLFIGDSVMQQYSAHLINALRFHNGTCSNQILFGHSDTLIGRAFKEYNRGEPWTNYFDLYQPDITILNVGPHVRDDNDFDEVLRLVLRDIVQYRKERPNRTFVWRTQQPGGCTSSIQNGTDIIFQEYNYAYLRGWDKKAREIFNDRGWPILDLQMMYVRSDAHPAPDCIHACLPGPADLFPVLVLHLLEDMNGG